MSGSIKLRTVDMHTCGEPVRIVVGGYPELPGATILEKRRAALDQHDQFRRAMMLEPRGHGGMYGVIPTEACDPSADFAVLFTHQEGYSTMCGHATIAVGRWAVESGRVALVNGRASFRLEVPCGVVDVDVLEVGGEKRVTFESVDSFASQMDHLLEVPGLGSIRLDIAFGGAFYAILPASRLGLSLMDTPLNELIAAGVAITDAGRAALAITHPTEADLGFLYGAILTDDVPLGPPGGGRPSYNLCIFADGQIDRSPTGSGVTARLALAAAKGELKIGDSCEIRGVSGQGFVGELAQLRHSANGPISRVKVTGTAFHSGVSEFICEAGDPFAYGFTLPARFSDLQQG